MKILMVGIPNMKNKNLLKILTSKLKYSKPEVEVIKLANNDIITSSGEMAEVEFEKKKVDKNEKEPPMLTDNDRVVLGTGNVVNVYPNGLPKNVLEVIDYSKFGAMLKQEQLLPPSYDKKPIKVEIDNRYELPHVVLTFKSKTSESYRLVGIFKYSVSYSTRMNTPIKVMEVNPLMIPLWRRFAESVMWAWENGYRYSLFEKIGPGQPQRKISNERSLKIIANYYETGTIKKDL